MRASACGALLVVSTSRCTQLPFLPRAPSFPGLYGVLHRCQPQRARLQHQPLQWSGEPVRKRIALIEPPERTKRLRTQTQMETGQPKRICAKSDFRADVERHMKGTLKPARAISPRGNREGLFRSGCMWARPSRRLTWRFSARRATAREKRCGGRRVRQHRHVRRRYLRYAASRAMPTKSATTATRRIPERSSTLTVYLFDQCGARLVGAQEKCRPKARLRQMRP